MFEIHHQPPPFKFDKLEVLFYFLELNEIIELSDFHFKPSTNIELFNFMFDTPYGKQMKD
jgi:hypothetical protein